MMMMMMTMMMMMMAVLMMLLMMVTRWPSKNHGSIADKAKSSILTPRAYSW